uniref:Ig-like domain-containing protein n=1 Tax=Ditylenchus dipsaci TaxID=166011 RepID=A0A915DZ78_9BILA
MPREQYDKWFSEEQHQVTQERKQKLIAKNQEQQQPGQKRQAQPAPSQQPVGGRTTTPQYIQRQLQPSSPYNNKDIWVNWPESEPEGDSNTPRRHQPPLPIAPIFRSGLRGLRLTEGTDAILQCSVVGVPKPKITWLKNNQALDISTKNPDGANKSSEAIHQLFHLPPINLLPDGAIKAQNSARIEVYPLNLTPVNASSLQRRVEAAVERETTTSQSLKSVHAPNPQAYSQQSQTQAQQQELCRREQDHQQTTTTTTATGTTKRVQQQEKEEQRRQELQRQQEHQRGILLRQQEEQRRFQLEQQQRRLLEEQNQRLLQENQRRNQELEQQRIRQAEREKQLYLQQQQHDRAREASRVVQVQQQQHWQQQPAVINTRNTYPSESFSEQQQTSYFHSPRKENVFDDLKEYLFEAEDNYVHPYRKLQSDQVQYYLLQQQQQKQLREQRMAPPPVTARQQQPVQQNQGKANGVAPQQRGVPQPTQKPGNAPAGGPVKPPQYTQMPQSQAVKQGEKAVFVAKATGQPVPTLEWLSADGKPLPNNPKKFQIQSSTPGQSQLTISQVTEKDLGTYMCVASNPGGSFQAQFSLQFPKVSSNAQSKTTSRPNQIRYTREKTEIPNPEPDAREKITLKKVDRYKQLHSAKLLMNDDQPAPPQSTQPPKFTTQLKSLTLNEGQQAMLDVKFSPTDDPNLKVAWLLNGKAILASSRITTINEFGYAVLEINPVTVFDHGEYTVVAVNQLGEARQSGTVQVSGHRSESVTNYYQQGKETQADTNNFVPIAQKTSVADRPNFHTEIRSQELFEGQPLHLETKLTPINDPNLKVEFYLNGNPVKSGDRVQTQLQSGFAVLSVAEARQEDAGYYVFRATNDAGVAETAGTVLVLPASDVQLDTTTVIDVEDVRELKSSQTAGQKQAPQFQTQLQDFHCEDELGRSYFDARIAPANDPTLRVTWLKDGHSLANANRIQTVNHFGFASLTIHPTYPEDAGTYTCVLNNSTGEAQSSATLTTLATDSLLLDPMHAQALDQINYIEGQEIHIGPILKDRPEEVQSLEQPRFARSLADRFEVQENEPVHFECRIQPANDVKMNVEWFHNGAPLRAANRIRPMFDFGYVALDLLYAYPEDSGTYTVIAKNELGEIQSSVELVVTGEKVLYLDAQHPEGLERIQELEQPKNFGLAEDLELNEMEDVLFELKATPVNDPTMVIEWFLNDQPLYSGSRFMSQNDFGFITLSIRGVIPEDSGVYTVRATNALGEDSRQCTVNVLGKEGILSQTQHEESLGKIEYLENLNKFAREEIFDIEPTSGPQFVEPLPGNAGEIEEGDPIHLECKVEPVGDNSLRVYWLRDGNPLPHAHRFRTFFDFGFVSLDILHDVQRPTPKFHVNPKKRSSQTLSIPLAMPESRSWKLQTRSRRSSRCGEKGSFLHQTIGGGQAIQAAEGDNIFLEAQTGPIDDNTLTYEWLFNDQPLMKAHRFVLSQDFGFAALNILYVYAEDSGTYTLVIRNSSGQEARSAVQVDVSGKDSLLHDTFHPSAVVRIEELEAPRPQAEEVPDAPKQVPQIVTQLAGVGDVTETQSLHMEAQYAPLDDNTLLVEWLHNGAPLQHSNRHRITSDFGYAALDICFVVAQDAGEYTLVVSNEAGQAQTSTTVQIEGSEVILSDPLHPESLRRIQEIEAVRPAEPTIDDLPAEAPQFTQQLSGPIEGLKEGQQLHLDCTVLPINDPKLIIEWYFNGQPLQFSSRIRTIHDFGYVALEFLHILAEDSGTYTCRAVNEAGEATTDITIECQSKRNIYLDPQHEESWVRIQEMENRQDIREPSPELTFPPPTFIVPLQNEEGLVEGDGVRLECRLQPVNDPTLKVFWTCNGQPLPEADRFMPFRNLDLVSLNIKTVAFGEASTSANLQVQPTDALLLDTQHQESWNQIQEFENRQPEEPIVVEPEVIVPYFVVNLPTGLPEFQEGEPIHLEAQIEPTNDNTLVVEWHFNGHPCPMVIATEPPTTSGDYTCVARNQLGEAQSQTSLHVASKEGLYLDPQHPNSWQKIQEIEAPKPMAEEEEPAVPDAPDLWSNLTPINDNKLVIVWLKDGQPLGNSNRFSFTNDFGFIALDIAHTVASDAGQYSVKAINEQGEAQVDGQLTVEQVGNILSDTQHETSWKRIQEIEAPKPGAEEAPDAEHGPPHFIQPLNSVTDLVEGQPAHFEAQVQPITDPNMIIQWYHNGRPLPASNKISFRNDFGLVTLDVHYVLAQDIGDYRCVATNSYGEDSTEGHLDCQKRPGLLLDPQQEESWRRIQEMEAPKAVAEAAEPAPFAKPQFTQPLQSLADVPEGQVAVFQGRVIPVNDPSMQIQWFLNDTPLKQSNRFTMSEDFGQVMLRINGVGVHDSGVYSCKAVNKEGAAITNASLSVIGEDSLQLDTAHPTSLQKIQELEGLDKFPHLEYPEQEFQKPVWVQTFQNIDVEDDQTGQNVQLQGQLEPVGDPTLQIEWFLNGVPLQNANRFRQDNNFGQVTLTIIHVLPHDSGVYSCRAFNEHGEAVTSATVKVAGYESILHDTMHPVSWDRIQELERPVIIEEIEVVEEKEKPRFLTQLNSFADVAEGEPIRLEATFQPARDNDLKASWEFNGHPLGASQLIKTRGELGWACLDINGVNMDHNGVYTLKIVNSEGEAASSASVKVAGVGDILGNTQHEESWRRIQILEAPKEKSPSPPPAVYETPSFQKQIDDVECNEGEPSRFEAAFLPNQDPKVVVQWVRNGVPLAHGSKYAISQDFGYCTLAIGYTYPEDEGVYQLSVSNANGEAVTSATLKCHPLDSILGDVQHEESWRRIQEIEAPKPEAPEAEPAPKQPPKFTTQIQSVGDLVEGQPAHFETTVEPIDDPDLKIQWYLNGAPVSASSRVKLISDFGWVILNINDTEQRDTGEWSCVATNSVGEATTSTTLNVAGRENLLLDPIQAQSLARIQEIEAPKPLPEEAPAVEYEAPKITVQLTPPAGDVEEGDSAHLVAQFTPVADPKLKVEWYLNGQQINHSNRYKMVNDFGFAILDILYLLAHDSGEFTVKVSNEAGEASTSVNLEVIKKDGLMLQPQSETKAKAVQDLEEYLNRRPEEVDLAKEERMPVFVEPLSAPVDCESGDRAHFTARYEPVDDNQLQVKWFLNNRPLLTGSRVKTINEFGYVVLEISPVYPEDSGDYVCKAINAVGEAVTTTSLTCTPKEGIIHTSQLPESMSGAQAKIHELETRRPLPEDKPDAEHGPPTFVTQLPSLPQLREGAAIHLDAQLKPVGDPKLVVEWFHDGQPVRNTNRMRATHDFGATNAQGQAETSCQIEVVGDSGVSYEWVSPGERRERIDELEEWINRPKDELMEAAAEFEAPRFTEQLADLGELGETEATSFMCVLEPIGDPSMHIEWQHDGHPIPYSNRIQMSNDFGVLTLTIKHLITQDSGEYQCIARNSKGEAVTSGKVLVQSLIEVETPQIIQPLLDNIDAQEGESVHLECRVAPINDPKLTVSWLRNGAPLADASRFKQNFEFGFVTLDILYAYPEDNGDYELVVTNDKGQASTKAHIVVLGKPSLEFAPQAPGSNVDNLEHHLRQFTRAQLALTAEDAYNPALQQAPVFKTNLLNVGVEEGDFCRFEAQLAPINDPYMKVEWYKDKKPVLIGTRFRNTLDFGFACLDLLYALPDDTGEYTCVASNKHGQAMLSAKLACSGKSHVITVSQVPQHLKVRDINKAEDNLHWMDTQGEQTRQKQKPQFTIVPRNLQVDENQPARFECAVVGNPKPKVIWYVNGNQALHGHRHKLNYDGVHYLTITQARISDVGTIEAIAKNSEGEVLASASLDVFQRQDFRQHKLRPANLKTSDELQQREVQWQRETMGSLGEAFEKAPKGDVQKLVKVERGKSPIEPLETEELVQKFTRPRDDQFYDKLSYVERTKPEFPGMELEPVALKPGKIEPYVPPKETVESVQLKGLQGEKEKKQASPPPDWAAGAIKLGEPVGKFNQLEEPERDLNIPARDQVKLRGAKPKPADDLTAVEHVRIEEDRAKLAGVKQGPPVEVEKMVPHADQVQLKQKFKTKRHSTCCQRRTYQRNNFQQTSTHQNRSLIQSGPTVQTTLKPVQAEIGRSATFSINFGGDQPVIVKWFHNGKELRSAFDTQIKTTENESRLELNKLKTSHQGEYTVRLENAGGQCESTANLIVSAATSKGIAPDFKQRLTDQRVQQNSTIKFNCVVTGSPRPTISWFKDGKQLPNDDRFQMADSEGETSLTLVDVVPPDAGIYECVAKSPAGEARCKARLNMILAKTGKGAESGPKLEAPRFTAQIQPVIGQEGGNAEFRAKLTGEPEPSIRWSRNNEPVKPSRNMETGHGNGEAWLKLTGLSQEDVAEYKCEAINPAGKATTIANLVLKPAAGKVIGGKPGVFQAGNTTSNYTVVTKNGGSQQAGKGGAKAPQFLQKLTSINARPGENVKLVAEIDGDPVPTVQWQFNGRQLPGDGITRSP